VLPSNELAAGSKLLRRRVAELPLANRQLKYQAGEDTWELASRLTL